MKKIFNTKISDLIPLLKNFFVNFFNEFSYSVLFWNAMLYITFFIIIFINLELAEVLSGIGSIFFLLICFLEDNIEEKYILWTPLTFMFWIFVLIGLFVLVCVFVSEKTIIPFNEWLNNLKNSK